ncbi:MAG: hypothetical protein IJI57_17030 [Flexilinea sp.]|nr:hypothetical protein [Flexilinea sp.]
MINYYLEPKYTTVFEHGCKILYGSHAAAGFLLTLAAESSVERPVHLLDFGNRCDMYYVARQLRYLTRDPAAAMQNIRLQRAFTCYQTLALLRQLETLEVGMPLFILDLLAPFLDENIRTNEVFRLFGEAVELLRCAMRTRPLLIGMKPVPQKLAPDRVCLAANLAREFGLIPVREALQGNMEESDGYRQRLAVRVFGSNSGYQKQEMPALMDGQPTLFDFPAG